MANWLNSAFNTAANAIKKSVQAGNTAKNMQNTANQWVNDWGWSGGSSSSNSSGDSSNWASTAVDNTAQKLAEEAARQAAIAAEQKAVIQNAIAFDPIKQNAQNMFDGFTNQVKNAIEQDSKKQENKFDIGNFWTNPFGSKSASQNNSQKMSMNSGFLNINPFSDSADFSNTSKSNDSDKTNEEQESKPFNVWYNPATGLYETSGTPDSWSGNIGNAISAGWSKFVDPFNNHPSDFNPLISGEVDPNDSRLTSDYSYQPLWPILMNALSYNKEPDPNALANYRANFDDLKKNPYLMSALTNAENDSKQKDSPFSNIGNILYNAGTQGLSNLLDEENFNSTRQKLMDEGYYDNREAPTYEDFVNNYVNNDWTDYETQLNLGKPVEYDENGYIALNENDLARSTLENAFGTHSDPYGIAERMNTYNWADEKNPLQRKLEAKRALQRANAKWEDTRTEEEKSADLQNAIDRANAERERRKEAGLEAGLDYKENEFTADDFKGDFNSVMKNLAGFGYGLSQSMDDAGRWLTSTNAAPLFWDQGMRTGYYLTNTEGGKKVRDILYDQGIIEPNSLTWEDIEKGHVGPWYTDLRTNMPLTGDLGWADLMGDRVAYDIMMDYPGELHRDASGKLDDASRAAIDAWATNPENWFFIDDALRGDSSQWPKMANSASGAASLIESIVPGLYNANDDFLSEGYNNLIQQIYGSSDTPIKRYTDENGNITDLEGFANDMALKYFVSQAQRQGGVGKDTPHDIYNLQAAFEKLLPGEINLRDDETYKQVKPEDINRMSNIIYNFEPLAIEDGKETYYQPGPGGTIVNPTPEITALPYLDQNGEIAGMLGYSPEKQRAKFETAEQRATNYRKQKAEEAYEKDYKDNAAYYTTYPNITY